LIDIGYIDGVESESGVGLVLGAHLESILDERTGRERKSRVKVCREERRGEGRGRGGKE
jgi:hypothetical protein